MSFAKDTKWVSIWGSAVSIGENRPETYGKNITLCYPVPIPFSGSRIHMSFDNYCGTEDITIAKAVVLYKDVFYPVCVADKESFSIKAGESITTDDLPLAVDAGDSLEIRFYLQDYTQMRSTVFMSGPLTSGRYAVGDHTAQKEIPIDQSRSTNYFYFLNNISLCTSKDNHAIVCFGDSITAQDWPDYLKLRCQSENFGHTSIIRRATSGSRILREYDCITYESYGLKGTNRFTHEVPTEGADILIIQQGINDIIHPVGTDVNAFRPMSDLPTADELIEGLCWYIKTARSYGYQVYVGTLLPIEGWRTYAPFREELKEAYNDFIRSTKLIDGCIDFAKALQNPARPTAFMEQYDSGDHLHPSAEGYRTMADCVPAKLLQKYRN